MDHPETNAELLNLKGSVELGGVPPSLSAGGTEVKSEHVNTQVSVRGLEEAKIKEQVLHKVEC